MNPRHRDEFVESSILFARPVRALIRAGVWCCSSTLATLVSVVWAGLPVRGPDG